MATPFFSVIIPTKNRAFLVGNAIRSVLEQTFEDFEIVLIDNDDSDATEQIVSTYTDTRLKYFRTGGLTMPDNWEYGFTEALGLYQLILEDKSVLKPRALRVIHDSLKRFPSEVVSWPQDLFNDLLETPVVSRGVSSGTCRVIPSDDILKLVMTTPRGYYETKLPRGLNSCLSKELIQKIKQGPTRRLCPPASPDYTMAYLQLAFTDTVLSIEDCLTVYGSCKYSHGRKQPDRELTRRRLQVDFGITDENELFRHVPIKANIPTVTLFNDYLSIREKVGGRLTRFPLDPKQLFLESFRDIQNAKHQGVDLSQEAETWEKEFKKQPPEIRRAVYQEKQRYGISLKTKFRQWASQSPLGAVWRRIKFQLGWQTPSDNLVRFATPLDYVQWEQANVLRN